MFNQKVFFVFVFCFYREELFKYKILLLKRKYTQDTKCTCNYATQKRKENARSEGERKRKKKGQDFFTHTKKKKNRETNVHCSILKNTTFTF